MLLSNSPRPDIGSEVFQWLGLADPLEGITQDRLHEIKQAFGGAALGFNPVAQIFQKFAMKDRQPD